MWTARMASLMERATLRAWTTARLIPGTGTIACSARWGGRITLSTEPPARQRVCLPDRDVMALTTMVRANPTKTDVRTATMLPDSRSPRRLRS